jgi:hypothetical protein
MPANLERPRSLMRFGGFNRSRRGMSKVSEYRHHAKECRGLAKQSRSAEHREMFLNIAATWESLANDRIKTAEAGANCKIGKNRTEEPQALVISILTQLGPSLIDAITFRTSAGPDSQSSQTSGKVCLGRWRSRFARSANSKSTGRTNAPIQRRQV